MQTPAVVTAKLELDAGENRALDFASVVMAAGFEILCLVDPGKSRTRSTSKCLFH